MSVTDGEPTATDHYQHAERYGSPGVVYQYQVQARPRALELTYTLEAAPAGAEITEGGNITWTPTEGQGGQVSVPSGQRSAAARRAKSGT